MSNAENCAQRRAERLAQGLCAQCGLTQHEPERTRCVRCLKMCRANSEERRAFANWKGVCQACLKRKQAPGRGRRCRKCADRYREAKRTQRAERSAA